MRDVARAVQADARRREILPDLERRLAALERPRRPAALRWGLAFAGAAACAAAVGVVFFRPVPLSYSVSAADELVGVRGQIGDRLVGPASGALALRFSDGSEVTLPPQTQAHVDGLDLQGATVAVEAGTVEVSVVHRAQTRWEVQAGRYRIHVTGTRFSAGWDPRGQTLTVTMHEGSVSVTGPGLKQPMRVATGQRLRANAGVDFGDEPAVSIDDANAPANALQKAVIPPVHGTDRTLEETPAGRAAPAALRPAPAAPVREPHAAAPARNVRHAVAAPQVVARVETGWRTQYARAQYQDALALAIREGWDTDCDRLGVEDVLMLGDIARLARDFPRAEEAYKIAHRRFPIADRPVYTLGLMALQHRDYAGAARRFDEYLRNYPRGPLVREAAELYLEAGLKSGDARLEREAATSYLHSYPDGPHAAQARHTVGP